MANDYTAGVSEYLQTNLRMRSLGQTVTSILVDKGHLDITPQDALLMLVLRQRDYRMTDLERLTGYKPNEAVYAIKKLEKSDLVRREVDQDRQTAKIVSLTATGRSLAGAISRKLDKQLAA